MKKDIKDFFGQGLLIVFSILLALGVNEWRANANQNAELKRAVQDLTTEISSNLANLEGVAEYHRAVAKSTRALAANVRNGDADLSKTIFELFIAQDVLQPSVLGMARPPSNVSWQIAKDRGIATQFDYELAKDLSQTNDLLINKVIEFQMNLANSFGSVDLHQTQNQAAHLSVLAGQFHELAAREDFLVVMLERNLKSLQEHYPKSATQN